MIEDFKKVDTVERLQEEWRDPYRQWYAAGMPAFATDYLKAWKQIKVCFRTKEDREAFSKLVGKKFTDKTNLMWFPDKPQEENKTNRYVEDE
jgi:hypothetical protein